MKAGGGASGGESTGLIVQVSNPNANYLLGGGNGVGRTSSGGVGSQIRGRHRGLPLSPPTHAPTSTGTIRFLPARNISNIARPLSIPHGITANPQKKMVDHDDYSDSIVDGKSKKHMSQMYPWTAVPRSTYGEIRSVMQDHNYCAQPPTGPPSQVLPQGVITPVKPNGSVSQYTPNGFQPQAVQRHHHHHQTVQHHQVQQPPQTLQSPHQHSLIMQHGMLSNTGRVSSPQNYHRPTGLPSVVVPMAGMQPSVIGPADPELSSDDDRDRPTGGSDGEETETANEDEDNSVTRCICDFQHDDGYMICCDKCLVWQHVDCMGIERGNIPDEYRCEECEPRRVDKARAVRLQLNKRAQFKDLTPEPQPASQRIPQPPPQVRNTPRKRTTSYSGGNKKEKKVKGANRWRSESKTKQKKQPKKRLKSAAGRKTLNISKGGSDSDRSLSSPVDNHNNNSSHSVNHNSNSAAAVAQLRQWIDSYEEAVTNHYSPELRARVASLKLNGVHNPPAIDLTKVPIPPVPKYRISLMPSGIKILQSTGSIPSGQVIVEIRGKFMLAKGRGVGNGPSPGPYVFYHKVSPEGTEICVDGRTYGNDARFVRRSCQPNSELRHCIEKGALHLYIVSTRSIDNKSEITLPLTVGQFCVCNGTKCSHDVLGNQNPTPQINYSLDKRRRGRRRTLSESSQGGNSVSTPTVPTISTPPQIQSPSIATSPAPVPPAPVPQPIQVKPTPLPVREKEKEKTPEVETKEATVPPPPPPPPPPPASVTPTKVTRSESPQRKKESPIIEKETKIQKEETTPTSKEEKKKVKRSLSVLHAKTAGSLLAGAVTTRRATTPSARTEEKRLRAHNGEPLPKDNSKMTREERKMEAIMKAFERMEKDEQRKQAQHSGGGSATPGSSGEGKRREPMQRKSIESSGSLQKSPRNKATGRRESRMSKVVLRTRGRINRTQSRTRGKPITPKGKKTQRSRSPIISSGDESTDDELSSPTVPRRPPAQRRRKLGTVARQKREPPPPSPENKDEENDDEEEEEEEEEEESDQPLTVTTPPSDGATPPPLSNTCLLVAAAVGPLAPGFKFPKTKKNMLNSWLVGEGGVTPPQPQGDSTPDITPTSDHPPTPIDAHIPHMDHQSNDGTNGDGIIESTAHADHCTAKKRWLRQAISEDSDSPRPECSGSPVEMAAPLKKRRVARESVSSDTAFTPPTTPQTESHVQIYEDEMVDENSMTSSPQIDNESSAQNENQELPTISNSENEHENGGNRTPKLFESPRSEDSKPQSPESVAVVPTASLELHPDTMMDDDKNVDKGSDDSELPPMQLLDDPESKLAAMEGVDMSDEQPVAVKSVEDLSKEHADAVELLNQLTTDEPASLTPLTPPHNELSQDSVTPQPQTPPANEDKEAGKIKRKLSISEYRERVKSYPPKQKKPSSEDEGTPDKRFICMRDDSDSDESSSELNTLLAKIDTSRIDLAYPTQPFKKASGGFSAEPTQLEKQREALTDRLKKEFGLFLSDDEDHENKFKGSNAITASSALQNCADGRTMPELVPVGPPPPPPSGSPTSSRHLRDRRTRRPPPPPPSGPPPLGPPVIGPLVGVPPPPPPQLGGHVGPVPPPSGGPPPPVSWPYYPAAPPPPPPPPPPPSHHPSHPPPPHSQQHHHSQRYHMRH